MYICFILNFGLLTVPIESRELQKDTHVPGVPMR